jgi:hypothetical protein
MLMRSSTLVSDCSSLRWPTFDAASTSCIQVIRPQDTKKAPTRAKPTENMGNLWKSDSKIWEIYGKSMGNLWKSMEIWFEIFQHHTIPTHSYRLVWTRIDSYRLVQARVDIYRLIASYSHWTGKMMINHQREGSTKPVLIACIALSLSGT